MEEAKRRCRKKAMLLVRREAGSDSEDEELDDELDDLTEEAGSMDLRSCVRSSGVLVVVIALLPLPLLLGVC